MVLTKTEREAPPRHLKEIAYSKIEDLEAGRVGGES